MQLDDGSGECVRLDFAAAARRGLWPESIWLRFAAAQVEPRPAEWEGEAAAAAAAGAPAMAATPAAALADEAAAAADGPRVRVGALWRDVIGAVPTLRAEHKDGLNVYCTTEGS